MDQISILSFTCEQYADCVRRTLGKGFDHAAILYREWFRTGKVTEGNPAFNNAKTLFQEITSSTNFDLLSLSDYREDGKTGKLLLTTLDGLEIESVLIPMRAGGTLCISSQVGCRMGCSFCETGRMGLLRNLSVPEIIGQVYRARFSCRFDIRNIVFMGMGEPFDNYDAVMQAVKILCDPNGFGFGSKHITISTSGDIAGIAKLMEENEPVPNLAVSINAPNDAVRNKLMPINRRYDMKALHKAMKDYCEKTSKQILAAYVLLKGINDGLEQADELATYLQNLDVKVNLIPYNPQSKDRYQPPEQEVLEKFTQRLRQHGYYTLLRQTKGQKIMAACGQLGNLKLKTQKLSKTPSFNKLSLDSK